MDYLPNSRPDLPGAGRDAQLRRLTKVRQGLAVGCVALVGGFSAFVAQAKPGKSTGTSAKTTTAPAGGKASSGPRFAQTPLGASSASSAPAVSPPAQAPVPAPATAPPATVSGGS